MGRAAERHLADLYGETFVVEDVVGSGGLLNLHSDSFRFDAHPARDESVRFSGRIRPVEASSELLSDTYRCAQLKALIAPDLGSFKPTSPRVEADVSVICDDEGLPKNPTSKELSANRLLVRSTGYYDEGQEQWWDALTQDAESLRQQTGAKQIRVTAKQLPAGQFGSRDLPLHDGLRNAYELGEFDSDASGRVRSHSVRQVELERWLEANWGPRVAVGFDARAWRNDTKPAIKTLAGATRRDVSLLSVRLLVSAKEPVDEKALSAWIQRVDEKLPPGLTVWIRVNRYDAELDTQVSTWSQPDHWTGTARFMLKDSSPATSLDWEWENEFVYGPETVEP